MGAFSSWSTSIINILHDISRDKNSPKRGMFMSDEKYVFAPKKGSSFYLLAFIVYLILLASLLIGVSYYTWKGTITVHNGGGMIFYFFVYIALPLFAWELYGRIGRWTIITHDSISYPRIFKHSPAKYIKIESLKGFKKVYSLTNKDEIIGAMLFTRDGKNIIYLDRYYEKRISKPLLKIMKRYGISEIKDKKTVYR